MNESPRFVCPECNRGRALRGPERFLFDDCRVFIRTCRYCGFERVTGPSADVVRYRNEFPVIYGSWLRWEEA